MLHGERHVVVVRPDDDEVVRVVGDARRERPTLEAGAGEEAEPDPPRREVPLDDGELDEVAFRVGDGVAVDDERLADERLRDDLVA